VIYIIAESFLNNMALLASTINDDAHKFPLVILQSSLAQSCLPILRHVINDPKPSFNLLFCLLYPPSTLADNISSDTVEIHDWLDHVPGYCDASSNTTSDLLDIVERGIHTTLSQYTRSLILK
jgi:elongator complex protein 5